MKRSRYFPTIAAILAQLVFCRLASAQSNVVMLTDGWRIQSSAQIVRAKEKVATTMPRDRTLLDMMRRTNAAAISSRRFRAMSDWIPATVPTTVLAALVRHGNYGKDIFIGTNLAKISPAPFTNSWWFRKEFSVTKAQAAENVDLIFNGINYRANIWLNGEQIADAENTFGASRIFKFDISGKLNRWKNVLAVEVFSPQPDDFTMGFVDRNPQPAAREMGLSRPVELHFYKCVALDNVFVGSQIDHTNRQSAALTIYADLKNNSDHAIETKVAGQIGDVVFSKNFQLQAGEKHSIKLTPEGCPQLNFTDAQLRRPGKSDEPHLYDLKLTANEDGEIADSTQIRFSIRDVSDDIGAEDYR
jgi:exo-1,4-beta-D-glucosaminidase